MSLTDEWEKFQRELLEKDEDTGETIASGMEKARDDLVDSIKPGLVSITTKHNYCSCSSPKKVASHAGGATFVVCSKGKGGCGKEMMSDNSKQVSGDLPDFIIKLPEGFNVTYPTGLTMLPNKDKK